MNKQRSKNEWQRLIEGQAASGLTQKVLCAQSGIAVATFGYWKRKLRDDDARHSNDPVLSVEHGGLLESLNNPRMPHA